MSLNSTFNRLMAFIGNVGGITKAASASFTRPSNTSGYTTNDVVSNSTATPSVMEFDLHRVEGGSGYVTKGRLMTDQKTNTAQYRLHLFHTAPTAINDNDPYLLLWANRANRVGYIDFDAASTEDSTNSTAAQSLNTDVRLAFVCAAGSKKLYGILETLTDFTPASAQNFYIELTAELN